LVELDCKSFILATLLNSGGTFESATKLQKIAFLSIYENGLEAFTDFIWHNYGPFSREIQEEVDVLSQEDLINEESISRVSYLGNEYTVKRLSLTNKGKEVAESVIAKMNEKNKTALLETIDKFGNKHLSQILQYVYTAYSPEDLSQ
jgi:uncharacterized protein YwgA